MLILCVFVLPDSSGALVTRRRRLSGLGNGTALETTVRMNNMQGYDKWARPTEAATNVPATAANISSTNLCCWQVSIGMALTSLVNMDAEDGSMEIAIWLRVWWKDERLAYAGYNITRLTTMSYSCDLVWCPDVMLYISAGKPMDSLYQTDISVYPSGAVSWSRPGLIRAPMKLVSRFRAWVNCILR